MRSRREFLALGITTAASAWAQYDGVDEVPLTELGQALALGRYTSVDLVHKYADRISRFDKAGPKLNSVLELNPDAESIAAALDRERKQNGPRGPLHGIPILLKDNIDTADRMNTTAGSLALLGSPAPRDAALVERLRTAGAVILGKTNLSEWANFRSTRSTSGWSGRGGQTRNPYALDRNPSGSSSGSAVAVAASLCAAAIGTETDGSIISPATANGIVGIKPTLGLIPGAGVIPISKRQDTAGPMARNVSDAALLLSVLSAGNYGSALGHKDGLKGARLGVVRDLFGAGSQLGEAMDEAVKTLKDLGALVTDPIQIPNSSKTGDLELEALQWEFKNDLNEYLQARKGPVKSLQEIIDFNNKNRDKELALFGQELLEQSQAKGPLTSRMYTSLAARLNRMAKSEGIDRAINDQRLDALIAPSGGVAWLTNYQTGDQDAESASRPAAIAGYPHITVPMAYISGLPVGLSFFGPPRSDARLIRYAWTFEQATQVRKPPQYLPTIRK